MHYMSDKLIGQSSQTIQVPPNYERRKLRRTETQQFHHNEKADSETTGPADYRHEQILGNRSITQFKSMPQYSFSRTAIHRTLESKKT